MSDLWSRSPTRTATAKQVAANLGEAVKAHVIELDDVVIVERRDDGKVKLHQPSMAGMGAGGWRAVGRPDRADLLRAAARHGDGRRRAPPAAR